MEYDLWRRLLENHDSNLKDLVKIYDSLNSLKFGIDYFTNSVNANLKKIIFIKYYFLSSKILFYKITVVIFKMWVMYHIKNTITPLSF